MNFVEQQAQERIIYSTNSENGQALNKLDSDIVPSNPIVFTNNGFSVLALQQQEPSVVVKTSNIALGAEPIPGNV